ncbi:MAG TPA: hypothetical protein VJV78_23170, partial [Polyangiales bacterium]|nr:hypothetical protein [Polyangiales bacterium]
MRFACARCLGVALLALVQCTQARPEVQAARGAGRGADVDAGESAPAVAADSGVEADAAVGGMEPAAVGAAGGGQGGGRAEA